MGWSATIVSDKEIAISEVEDIVKRLPPDLTSIFSILDAATFNGWGWSAITDISVPNENKLRISGSYGISVKKAKPMANFLKKKLEEHGHNIKVEIGECEIHIYTGYPASA